MPFGISVYRDFDENITTIKTLKVKFLHLGNSQQEARFKYNINNGRYTPEDEEYDNRNYLKKDVQENKIELVHEELEPDTNFLTNDIDGDVPF